MNLLKSHLPVVQLPSLILPTYTQLTIPVRTLYLVFVCCWAMHGFGGPAASPVAVLEVAGHRRQDRQVAHDDVQVP